MANENKSYLVLLSAGLDSTLNLFEAMSLKACHLAVTFDYGQRAASREIEKSAALCKMLSVPHEVIELKDFKRFTSSSLININSKIPQGSDVSIDNLSTSQKTASSVWVPNRNGVFLNFAAAVAEEKKIDHVVPGFNLEEALTFPDNSQEFISAVNESLKFSTLGRVSVHSFTVTMNKSQIVKRGIELKVPWAMTWPCYQAQNTWCGECESCLRAERAFASQGLSFQSLKQES